MTSLESLVATVLGIAEQDVTEETGAATTSAWSSLRHVHLVAEVENTFGVRLSPREARSCRSVRDLRLALKGKGLDL
ncbi:acyl carrier protein [Actinocrispum wychmicini]|uniref:Acyl carrier protein n=1 Tax=Actinocrispum wychmicini TaxID=1213861 RepID=A0A4R2IJL3_9PSEU|nr:acyl carrier protein [Actinocrispum wychmicini]TCO45241.1 acyl carrier protein [Actinocrispum wychmicini]